MSDCTPMPRVPPDPKTDDKTEGSQRFPIQPTAALQLGDRGLIRSVVCTVLLTARALEGACGNLAEEGEEQPPTRSFPQLPLFKVCLSLAVAGPGTPIRLQQALLAAGDSPTDGCAQLELVAARPVFYAMKPRTRANETVKRWLRPHPPSTRQHVC